MLAIHVSPRLAADWQPGTDISYFGSIPIQWRPRCPLYVLMVQVMPTIYLFWVEIVFPYAVMD